jgi:hypothetical protein
MSLLKKLVCKSIRDDFIQHDFDSLKFDVTESKLGRNMLQGSEPYGYGTNERLKINHRVVGRREGEDTRSTDYDSLKFDDTRSEIVTESKLGRNLPQGSESYGYGSNEGLKINHRAVGRREEEDTRSTDYDSLESDDTRSEIVTESKLGRNLPQGSESYGYGTNEGSKINHRVVGRREGEDTRSTDYIVDEVRKSLRGKARREDRRSTPRHGTGSCPPASRNSQERIRSYKSNNPVQHGRETAQNKHASNEQIMNPNYGDGYFQGCANLVADLIVEDETKEEKRPKEKRTRGRVQFASNLQETYRIPRHEEEGSYHVCFVRPSSSTVDDTISCSEETVHSESIYSSSTYADDLSNFDDSSMGSVEMLVHHLLCTQDDRITARDWIT